MMCPFLVRSVLRSGCVTREVLSTLMEMSTITSAELQPRPMQLELRLLTTSVLAAERLSRCSCNTRACGNGKIDMNKMHTSGQVLDRLVIDVV